MALCTLTIDGERNIKYHYRDPYTARYTCQRLTSLKELPENIFSRMLLLDAARGNDMRAKIERIGMTRPRLDGGTHYEFYVAEI